MQKIQTSDKDTRLGFKARMADKIAQSLVPPVNQEAPIVEPVQVTIPVNFHTMSKYHLFGYLTHEERLTLEQANDVIALLLDENPVTSNAQYNINLQGVHSPKELEAECTLPEPPKSIEVELPHNFNSLRVQDRFLWLMKESHLGLTTEEANDIIDIAQGKTPVTHTGPYTGTLFSLTYNDAPPIPEPSKRFSNSAIDDVKITLLPHFDVPEFPEGFELKTRVEQYRVLTDDIKLTPEHARFVLDTLQVKIEAQEPAPLEPTIVHVSLPHAFKGWVHKDQFNFLTKVRHLSTSDAEDVLGHYDGMQTLSTVILDWEEIVDTEGRQSFKQKTAERVKKAKAKVINPDKIQKFDMPDLPEEFTLWAGIDQFRYLTISLALTPEHAHLILNSLEKKAVPVAVVKEEETPRVLSVSVPLAFNNWNASDRYEFLTHIKQLPTSDANDVLAYFKGETTLTSVEVSWEDLVDPKGRQSFKHQLAERIQNTRIKESLPAYRELAARRVIEDVEDISTIPDAQPEFIDITLPIGFNDFKPFDQHLYLTRTLKLPIDLAERLLSGDPVFNITFADASEEVQAPHIPVSALPVLGKKAKNGKNKVFVSLPPAFNSLATSEQYWYLVKTKELSYAEANDCLALLNNSPQTGNVEFVIDWEE